MGKLNNAKITHYELSNQKQRTKAKASKKKEPLKITYISSPTLVKATNASEFRALVQELTGKDSRVGEDDHDEYSERYYSPVTPSPATTEASPASSVEDHRAPYGYSSSLDEFDCSYLEGGVGEDGYLSNGSNNAINSMAVAAAGVVGNAGSYSAVEREEGGFSLWRDVPDTFGNGGLQYSLNCVFV
ncbi:unnamed protein product [Linum tenue]|uniref:VQ domain-containing protein n=1 Tax=Linum tenue TaxID=586396 RepID=A0AAV0LIX3_9ROSI|nr:unnamed protein product [Linum tenue]